MKHPTISLWQPWATLWALGEKRIETRSWSFPRSLENRTIHIHAAAKWNRNLASICAEQPFAEAFRRHPEIVGMDAPEEPGVTYRKIVISPEEHIKLPFGAVIGTVQLAHDLDVWYALGLLPFDRRRVEEPFGDYSPGRRAWVGARHTLLPQPVPFVGKQGFFDFKSEMETR